MSLPPDEPRVHDFRASLARSHSYADAPWWLDVYRTAFPTLQSAVCVRGDGWAQRGGIDRVLILASGKTLLVDEKVREKAWPDIALEYWSDEQRKVPGWVAKDLACDFIAYAFAPVRTCYLLPFHTLRRTWHDNRNTWVAKYPRIKANNSGYVTVSVGVPIAVLLAALADAITIRWTVEPLTVIGRVKSDVPEEAAWPLFER